MDNNDWTPTREEKGAAMRRHRAKQRTPDQRVQSLAAAITEDCTTPDPMDGHGGWIPVSERLPAGGEEQEPYAGD
jgi:hypothetical protein